MGAGPAILILIALPIFSLAAVCFRLACRWSEAEIPGFGASLWWVFMMGGASNGAAALVRNQLAPRMAGDASSMLLALQAVAYLLIPFFVIRLFVCEETGTALRIHGLNLLLTALLAVLVVAAVQLLR